MGRVKSGRSTWVRMVISGAREVEEYEGEGRGCRREAIWTVKELRNPGPSLLTEASSGGKLGSRRLVEGDSTARKRS